MGRYILQIQAPGGAMVDMTKCVQTLNWSGDLGQIARQVTATLAVDLPAVTLPQLGDALVLHADGDLCFTGTLVKRQQGSMANTLEVTALDGGWRLAQNQGYYKFKNVSAKEATATLCRDFGIPQGNLADGGGVHSRKFPGVALDKIIGSLYTLAGEASGARYHPRFAPDGRLEVVEKPKETSLMIAPRINSMGVSVSEDISKMTTRVAIYSDDGKPMRQVTGEALVQFQIPLQRVIIQGKGKDAEAEALAYLDDNGLKQSITVDALGDTRLRTGNAVLLRENSSGAVGLCWIESDTHTFKNRQYFSKLKLNMKNMMNEVKGGSDL